MTWRQIVDRSQGHIEQLAPTFRERVAKWYAELLAKRIPVLVYCSVRTLKEQDELYAIGRTKKGAKVTNAKGTPVCQSFHCYGRAIDAVPCSQSASGDGYVTNWSDAKAYGLLRNCAEKYNMRWLSWETPHFEDANFKDWRELSACESIGTRVAEKNRPATQAQNTRVSKGSTKQVRKVSLRKP
jgi:peptidoglycan L-alanyl-D-glutamate endopeptidase CwlK